MRKVSDIIREYRRLRSQYPDPWIEDCMSSPLSDAVRMAATARDKRGRKHPHQNILNNSVLNTFGKRVSKQIKSLSAAKTFRELYQIVGACAIGGIGDLTVYDTAHRIGKNLGIDPDEVYIHRGTKIGAERILGRKVPEKTLGKNIFKGMAILSSEEIEDILCIYKDDFFKSRCFRVNRVAQSCSVRQ